MVKLPKTLKIGYQCVKIIQGKFNFEEDHGKYNDESAELCINTNKEPAEIVNTLIHETLHALFHHAGARDCGKIPPELEEYICAFLGNGLAQVFGDNPGFLRAIEQGLK